MSGALICMSGDGWCEAGRFSHMPVRRAPSGTKSRILDACARLSGIGVNHPTFPTRHPENLGKIISDIAVRRIETSEEFPELPLCTGKRRRNTPNGDTRDPAGSNE